MSEDAPEDASTRPTRSASDTSPAEATSQPEQPEAEDWDSEEEEPARPTPVLGPAGVAPLMMDASTRGTMRPLDASLRADASGNASMFGDASSRSVCAGAVALGACWYLGGRNVSCDEVCADHGGFDPSSLALVGTPAQGGSLANCREVMSALAVPGLVVLAVRLDRVGVGCHRWSATNYWLASNSAPFDPSTSAPVAEIACACTR